jgi:hypothetical protein
MLSFLQAGHIEFVGTFRQFVRSTPLYRVLNSIWSELRRRQTVKEWQNQGRPLPPPPDVKHSIIRNYGKIFQLNVLVETGTFSGDTIAAMKRHFSDIYSIELSPELHRRAKDRFAGDSRVHLLLGNSGDLLKETLRALPQTPLFWLDAHYSGGSTARGPVDTPIIQELEAILALRTESVVLIDDARLFDGSNSYPTLAELTNYVAEKAPSWIVEVKHDIIRLHRRLDLFDPKRGQ